MNIDSTLLHCFIAIAETKSFTKAAQRVCRTQSAISQQIAKLESYLEKPLFNRNKSLTLTPDGEIFLAYAKQIFSLHNEVIDRFKKPELQGEVRFGLPEDFASIFLSEVLADFSRLHPRILVKIETDLTLNLLERFRNKELDLVLVKMSQPKDFPEGEEVFSAPLKWVGAPSYKEAQKGRIPLVLAPQPCVYRARALTALENSGKKWNIIFSSQSYAGTMAAVRAGMGLTVLPKNMIPKDLVSISSSMPPLDDTHISLLKYPGAHPTIASLEAFVLQRLK